MTHGVTSCSSVPPFRESFAAYAVKKRHRAETDWYFMCCCLLPHPVAWGYIIYQVPCPVIRAPFTRNSKAFTTTWLERWCFVSRSLSRDHCTLSMVLTERKHNKQLSIYSPLCCRLCFSAIPFSISTALLRFSCSKARQCRLCNNEGLFSERHWKLCWEPRATSIWMAAIGVCPATHDFISHL